MTIFPHSLFARAPSPWDNPEPVREELFSAERIEEHARSLAAAQKVTPKPTRGIRWPRRLAENGAVLLAAYKSLLQGDRRGPRDHAGGGMADRQLPSHRKADPRNPRRTCRPAITGNCRSSPTGLSPAIRGCSAWPGPSSPTPTAASIPTCCVGYVRAYQEVQPLTIGELWAVAITLRIVLIENLRRLAEQIVSSRAARQQADDLADRLLGAAGQAAEPLERRARRPRGRRALRKPSPSSSSTGCATRTRRSRRP